MRRTAKPIVGRAHRAAVERADQDDRIQRTDLVAGHGQRCIALDQCRRCETLVGARRRNRGRHSKLLHRQRVLQLVCECDEFEWLKRRVGIRDRDHQFIVPGHVTPDDRVSERRVREGGEIRVGRDCGERREHFGVDRMVGGRSWRADELGQFGLGDAARGRNRFEVEASHLFDPLHGRRVLGVEVIEGNLRHVTRDCVGELARHAGLQFLPFASEDVGECIGANVVAAIDKDVAEGVVSVIDRGRDLLAQRCELFVDAFDAIVRNSCNVAGLITLIDEGLAEHGADEHDHNDGYQ